MKRLCFSLVVLGTLTLCDAHASKETRGFVQTRMLRLALEQAERMTPDWDPAQRDCAGFVRYLFRKALGAESRLWSNSRGEKVDYLGAGELVAYNFKPVSSRLDLERIQSGDLLVYYSPHKKATEAWHLMMIFRPPPMATDRPLAIYHTGQTPGEVRKVWIDDLLTTSLTEWRPVPINPRFRGVYRWKGWSKWNSPSGGTS